MKKLMKKLKLIGERNVGDRIAGMMKRVVLDTNIIVSTLWSGDGKPSDVFNLFLTDKIQLYYSAEILEEYIGVLYRPKFRFSDKKIGRLIAIIRSKGVLVEVSPSVIDMIDESDRIFYDVAKEFKAMLITGNIKHYPKDELVMTAAGFLSKSGV